MESDLQLSKTTTEEQSHSQHNTTNKSPYHTAPQKLKHALKSCHSLVSWDQSLSPDTWRRMTSENLILRLSGLDIDHAVGRGAARFFFIIFF